MLKQSSDHGDPFVSMWWVLPCAAVYRAAVWNFSPAFSAGHAWALFESAYILTVLASPCR